MALGFGFGFGLQTGSSAAASASASALPTLNLDLLNSQTLSPAVTFVRASSGSYYDSSGVLQQAAVNLLFRSEEFNDAAWTKVGIAASTNVTSPYGTPTAQSIVEDSSTGAHSASQTRSIPAGSILTYSLWVKASSGGRYIRLQMNSDAGANGFRALFNPDTGAFALPAAAFGTGTALGTQIEAWSDGWYRVSLTGTVAPAATVASANLFLQNQTATYTATYTGDGTSGLYLWGAQLQTGSTATTYIPTTSTVSGAPRFDHDPTQYYPNLLTYPETFDNAAWLKNSASVTANSATAPNGLQTADKLVEAVGGAFHKVSQNITVADSTTYTFSVFVEAGERTVVNIGGQKKDAGFFGGVFDLSTGLTSGSFGPATLTMQQAEGGFYRCSISFATGTGGTTPSVQVELNNGSGTNYAGDGTSGAYIWGAKLEPGAVATTYDNMGLVTQNLLTYSEDFANAAWGTVPSPITANAAVAPDGKITADLSIPTTNSAAHYISQTATYTSGTPYTFSVFAKAAGYEVLQLACSGTAFPALPLANFNLTTGQVVSSSGGATASIQSFGNGWYRCTITATAGGTGALGFFWGIYPSGNPARLDTFTGNGTSGLYLWGAQLNVGNSPLPYQPTTTAAITRCVPRGLLIEEQRTNSAPNNTMVGAVAGSPGTLPTTWGTYVAPTGLTRTIVGTGTQNGISYIDVRYAGTPSSTNEFTLYLLPTLAASTGQAWAGSAWVGLVGGTTTNIASVKLRNLEFNTGVYLRESSTDVVSVLSATMQRFAVTTASAGASTNQIILALSLQSTAVTPLDITLRIGMPQFELGAFPTSVIATSTAAATRAADIASMTGTNFSSWYNPVEGTIVVTGRPISQAANQVWISINDSTAAERMRIVNTSASQIRFSSITGGVETGVMNKTLTLSSSANLGGAYKLNDYAFSINGDAVTTDTTVIVPIASRMDIGSDRGSVIVNGWLEQILYYPTRQPNTVLPALTS